MCKTNPDPPTWQIILTNCRLYLFAILLVIALLYVWVYEGLYMCVRIYCAQNSAQNQGVVLLLFIVVIMAEMKGWRVDIFCRIYSHKAYRLQIKGNVRVYSVNIRFCACLCRMLNKVNTFFLDWSWFQYLSMPSIIIIVLFIFSNSCRSLICFELSAHTAQIPINNI